MLYPVPRSDEDETEATGPCGGFAVSDNRTPISMNNFPIALEMGHDRSVIQMLLALGNDPGNNFNITLEQTFQQQGEGDFCLPHVQIPSGLGITDGTNGTLQVITDGEGGGGLYIVSPEFLVLQCVADTAVRRHHFLQHGCRPSILLRKRYWSDGQPTLQHHQCQRVKCRWPTSEWIFCFWISVAFFNGQWLK